MYKIIGKEYYKGHNKYAKVICTCGYKTESRVEKSKKGEYKPRSLECYQCSSDRIFGNIKYRLNNYVINENGCHIWQGDKTKYGYGRINNKGNATFTHRIVWEQANGLISKGLVIRHKCDNPSCINLDHLEIGTLADNNHDRVNRDRSSKGEKHWNAKLTEVDIKFIRSSNKSLRQLGQIFNVANTTIHDIVCNKTWRHIEC